VSDPQSETPSEPAAPKPSRGPKLALLAALSAVLGLGAVYGIGGLGGNAGDAGKCAGTLATATRLKPFAKGEVAAFTPAEVRRDLSALTFDRTGPTPTTIAAWKGRVVLLNLWATWCVPCRKEMPALDRLQAMAGSKDFEVAAVNIDTTRLERPKAFLDEIGVKSLTRYADPAADVFQVLKRSGKALGLPTTLLIGADGCEIGVMAGPAEWDAPEALAMVRAAVGG